MEIIRKAIRRNGVNPSTLQPEEPPEPTVPGFEDNIRMVDPTTGQPVVTELDQLDLPPGGDWLRAIYQVMAFMAGTFVGFAKTTPALADLNPELTRTMDQFCTAGYQVTNAGAELTRGLWNWPTSRVHLNRVIETWVYAEESKMFDILYAEWYNDLVAPIEAGVEEYDSKKVVEWLKSKPEIADPKGFVLLARTRRQMEVAAERAMWTPTDMFKLVQPGGVRKTSTTTIHTVFRRKPG